MSDDMPMCEACYSILDPDGSCPDVEEHPGFAVMLRAIAALRRLEGRGDDQ